MLNSIEYNTMTLNGLRFPEISGFRKGHRHIGLNENDVLVDISVSRKQASVGEIKTSGLWLAGFVLGDLDSNQDRQGQNLLFCR